MQIYQAIISQGVNLTKKVYINFQNLTFTMNSGVLLVDIRKDYDTSSSITVSIKQALKSKINLIYCKTYPVKKSLIDIS